MARRRRVARARRRIGRAQRRIRRGRRAVVLDRQHDRRTRSRRRHLDAAPRRARRDGVTHGVLHQRLQREDRHDGIEEPVLDGEPRPEPLPETQPLERQAALDEVPFFAKPHLVEPLRLHPQRVAQDVPEQLAGTRTVAAVGSSFVFTDDLPASGGVEMSPSAK